MPKDSGDYTSRRSNSYNDTGDNTKQSKTPKGDKGRSSSSSDARKQGGPFDFQRMGRPSSPEQTPHTDFGRRYPQSSMEGYGGVGRIDSSNPGYGGGGYEMPISGMGDSTYQEQRPISQETESYSYDTGYGGQRQSMGWDGYGEGYSQPNQYSKIDSSNPSSSYGGGYEMPSSGMRGSSMGQESYRGEQQQIEKDISVSKFARQRRQELVKGRAARLEEYETRQKGSSDEKLREQEWANGKTMDERGEMFSRLGKMGKELSTLKKAYGRARSGERYSLTTEIANLQESHDGLENYIVDLDTKYARSRGGSSLTGAEQNLYTRPEDRGRSSFQDRMERGYVSDGDESS